MRPASQRKDKRHRRMDGERKYLLPEELRGGLARHGMEDKSQALQGRCDSNEWRSYSVMQTPEASISFSRLSMFGKNERRPWPAACLWIVKDEAQVWAMSSRLLSDCPAVIQLILADRIDDQR